ncbi:uncharacterized protein EDB91DRAFT_1059702 [Suillus paluster]|uniref:uncharacterized protein n=1 Tax=Suillus paluster TaxID=48578 RepID=UPI001B87D863|nr:uncharacterized protein EDB91DRAFT_1059702 [Suillus paluster]KAG1730122.1 hypothetical protein EDB91DRAFT_1059702 [Suillus paluster]
MSILNADITHILINDLLSSNESAPSALLNLASTTRSFRESCLPFLFSEVRWPHKSKGDKESGLHFFPEGLWPYIRHFQLEWPDEWTEPTRLKWGTLDIDGNYIPHDLGKLNSAIADMPKLSKVSLRCPFIIPRSLSQSLGLSRSLSIITFVDTPLQIGITSISPAVLKQISFTPVGQILRIGDGPTDPKFADISYFIRDWRRKYRSHPTLRQMQETQASLAFVKMNVAHLTHLELSGSICSFGALSRIDWPCLQTFALTGHAPVTQPYELPAHVQLFSVLTRMGALRDLRLLFAQSKAQEFHILGRDDPPDPAHTAKLSTLTDFAISNACNLDGVLNHMSSLERLAILAIVELPRWPIALGQAEVDRVLTDIAASGCELKHLRVIIEDKLTPEVCWSISSNCPHLQILEIERCGYHDGKSVSGWQEFLEPLSTLSSLRDLRICMQFPEYDDVDELESWRTVRKDGAKALAMGLKLLGKVGFEYRKRTGTHRYQDAWLDFEVSRRKGGDVELYQLPAMWYAFPEVWESSRSPF